MNGKNVDPLPYNLRANPDKGGERGRIVVPTVHPQGDQRILRCVQAALNAGFSVTVIWLGDRPAAATGTVFTEVVLPSPGSTKQRLLRVVEVVRAAWHIDAEAWHVHDLYLLPFARRWAIKNGRSFIYDQHEFYDLYYESRMPAILQSIGLVPRLVNALQLRMVAGVGAANVVHPAMASLYEQRAVRVSVTPNYPQVDPAVVHGLLSWSERPNQVIHIGTLSEPYGMNLLQDISLALERAKTGIYVDAIARFPSRAIRERFNTRRAALGGLPHLRVIDAVPPPQLIPLLGTYRVGLSLIDDSGQNSHAVPTKLYEQTIAGVVSVVSARSAQVEYLRSVGVGAVVASDDAAEWAAAIADALRPRQPEVLVQTLQSARDTALQTGTWNEVGTRLEELFLALVEPE